MAIIRRPHKPTAEHPEPEKFVVMIRDLRGQQVSRTCWTAEEAERVEKEMLAERDAGRRVKLDPKTKVRTLAARWLAAHEEGGCEGITLAQHKAAVAHYIEPRLGHLAVADVERADLEAFFAWMSKPLPPKEVRRDARGLIIGRKGPALSTTTQQRVRVTLKAILDHAIEGKCRTDNPLALVKRKREVTGKRERGVPTEAEMLAILRAANEADAMTRAAVFLLHATGMRGQEVLGLMWGAVDLEAGAIKVATSLNHRGRVKTGAKTNAGARTLASLDPAVVGALRVHRNETEERRGRPVTETDLVFCTDSGKPISHGNFSTRNYSRVQVDAGVSRLVKRKGKSVEVGKFTLHSPRHGFASLAIQKGHMPLPQLAAHLGHRNATVTMRVYAHDLQSAEERGAAAANVTGGLFASINAENVVHFKSGTLKPLKKRRKSAV